MTFNFLNVCVKFIDFIGSVIIHSEILHVNIIDFILLNCWHFELFEVASIDSY